MPGDEYNMQLAPYNSLYIESYVDMTIVKIPKTY